MIVSRAIPVETLEAVLFDVDGTLLNTFEFIYRAFEHSLALYGSQRRDRSEISRHMGGPLEHCYAGLAPEIDPALLAEAHRSFQAENIHLAELFPHTLEVLEDLTHRGYKLAAVTTRSLRSSVRSMELTGIAKYFSIILSAEDVSNHKPHPEPLLRALETLHVAPERAVMVGDTYADIEAGKNAGTWTVGAIYGFAGDSLLSTDPDIAISTLRELLVLLQTRDR